MNANPDITNIDPEIPNNAVSLYGQDDAMDDFPVLKAFQQYIDAEQAKSRKRMVLLCAFFSVLMVIVISVFVVLLFTISSRNQSLNDRLIDFAMKERNAPQPSGSAVVVQPPADNSAILQLTEKLNEMQKRLADSQTKAAQAEALALEASKPKVETPEELEIKRLKALLSQEKEQRALEKERQHQAEIEAYRRKHYPELYEKPVRSPKTKSRKVELEEEASDVDAEIEAILKDSDAISYFDDDDEDEEIVTIQTKKRKVPPSSSSETRADPSQKGTEKKDNYSIPIDVKGSSSNWDIPLE